MSYYGNSWFGNTWYGDEWFGEPSSAPTPTPLPSLPGGPQPSRRSIGQTRFTLQHLIDHAIARCKIPRQRITAEHQEIARENLSMALAELANATVPLWCQESLLLPVYAREKIIQLPAGTVDLLPESVFYRTMFRVGDIYSTDQGGVAVNAGDGNFNTSLVQTAPDGSITVQFMSPTVVNQVGFLADGDQWHNFVFEASNDGLTYTLLQTLTPQAGEMATFYADKQWAWYEVASPPTSGSLFFRVRETARGIIAARELYLGNTPTDIPMARLNRQQYLTLPNKAFTGRPLQFWLSRDLNPAENYTERPNMYLWPVPGIESAYATVSLMRHRYIADLNDYNAVVELPVRWYDPMIWWIAAYMASELPDVPQEREIFLQTMAKKELGEAMDEERDNSPILIQADISAYTR